MLTHWTPHVSKYVDQKGLAAKRAAGVAPEVNLKNPLQARKYANKGSILALNHRADVTRSPKQGYQLGFHNKPNLKNLSDLTEIKCNFEELLQFK